jgi:apolipoprotein N-acyltransferase
MALAKALICTALSGAAFYFSVMLGAVWPLAWLAPIPVLWLMFGTTRWWLAFPACWLALVIGTCNVLPAYWGRIPAATLATVIVILPLGFALCALGARFVAQRVSPLAGAIVFAALWTSFDFVISFGPNGTAMSPAYSQVGMPLLIQSASVFGIWSVTFLLGAFAAGIAAALAARQRAPAALAIVLVLANAGYGEWRMATAPKTPTVRVGLAGSDALERDGSQNAEKPALAVADNYAQAARALAGASLVVFPEKVLSVSPQWRGAVKAEFETVAHITHETIVIGVDEHGDERRNNALIYFANGTPPLTYSKRRMVPGLEDAYVPGEGSFMLASHIGVEICKDMDFPDMLRRDAALQPTMMAVPAWDFGPDGWWHARLAIMGGVENGFSVARAANDGLLTLSDAYGRVLARRPSGTDHMATLSGELPRGPGRTLFARVGDSFAWFCLGLSLAFLGRAAFGPRR